MIKNLSLLCLPFHFLKKALPSIIMVLFFLSNSSANTTKGIADDILVTGKVIDQENNQPLSKVNVTIKGTAKGFTTNSNGEFSISVPNKKAILVFSYIGYLSEEIPVGNRTEINVTLIKDAKAMEEVVVVGYGELRKKDLTGSVASVKVDDKIASQSASMDRLLQGRAAGVDVVSGSGAPGAALNVRIRGIGTLTGNTEPLYVVDGIIMNTASQEVRQASTNGNYSQENQNGLTALNPQDIESIEILKDASATAIYGSRGANGVVLITTKKGKEGKTTINFRSSIDVSQVSKRIEVLDGREFALYDNEFAVFQNQVPLYAGTKIDSIKTIDWYDYSFRSAVSQNYRLSLSGKTQKTSFYMAGGFSDFQGVIKNTGLKRGDFRINLINEISPKLKVTSNTSLIYQINNWAQGTDRLGQGNSSMIRSILRKSPLIGLDTLSDIAEDEFLSGESPKTWFEEFVDKSTEFRMLSSLTFDYKFSKLFAYRMVLGADFRTKKRSQFFGKGLWMGMTTNGRATYSDLNYTSAEMQNLLLITPKLAKKHNLSGTVGVTYDNNLTSQTSTVSENFFTPALGIDGFSLGQNYYPLTLGKSQVAVLSALSRAVYNYNNRYFLTATGRYDGSSRFAPGNKFGFFSSFAAAWKISNEKFFSSINAISDLKLRLGWGQTGVQSIAPYQTRGLYNANTYPLPGGSLSNGQIPARIANEDLTWETSEQANLGLDLALLKNRVKFNLDFYNKKSVDLLQNFRIAPSNGFLSLARNFGTIENKGFDLMVDGVMLENKSLKVSVGANFSINRNKLLDLGLPISATGIEKLSSYFGSNISTSNINVPANIFAQGYPVGMFWGLKTNGIVQRADQNLPTYKGARLQPGDIKFVDQNKDGIINDADKTFLGDPNPAYNYGFNTSVSYKNIKLDVFFTGVGARDIVNANWQFDGYASNRNANIRKEAYYQAWRPTAESNTFPRIGVSIPSDLSDRFIEDGSYLRLSNLNLSYLLTPKNKRVFSNIEFFVSGRNLLLFTDYKGFDPDVNSNTFNGSLIGVDFNSYPNSKSVNFGLSANF